MFCPLVELKMETVSDVNVLSSMPVENVMTISALDGTLVAPPTGEVELIFSFPVCAGVVRVKGSGETCGRGASIGLVVVWLEVLDRLEFVTFCCSVFSVRCRLK